MNKRRILYVLQGRHIINRRLKSTGKKYPTTPAWDGTYDYHKTFEVLKTSKVWEMENVRRTLASPNQRFHINRSDIQYDNKFP